MEPVVSDWDLVIKVKYGDTLRRFGACVREQSMDHDMTKLKVKIAELFKFSPDVDFILTYTDEDGDTVTLDNDDELCDAVIGQCLNPLRINVHLKSRVDGKSDSKPKTVRSTSPGSPNIQSQPSQIPSALNEAAQSVPEQVRGPLSKLCIDLVSKATPSSSAVADFLEHFLKMGQLSNTSQSSHPPSESSAPATGPSSTDYNVREKRKASTDITHGPALVPGSASDNPVSEGIPKQRELVSVEEGVMAKLPASINFNMDVPRRTHASGYNPMNDLLSSIWTTDSMELGKEPSQVHNNEKSAVGSLSMPPAIPTLISKSDNINTSEPSYPPYGVTEGFFGGSSSQVPAGTNCTLPADSNASVSRLADSPSYGGPPPSWFNLTRHLYRRIHGYDDGTFCTFHQGVWCDSCGMLPIMGPRFKSNVYEKDDQKEDYDLCCFCFSKMGNEADYTRIDRAPNQCPRLFKESYDRFQHPRYHPSSHHGHDGTRSSRTKLDSRFIQDVTVLDGTTMPASTPFTKIWRMHNNGNTAWPLGTQLVWIGGDQLGDLGSVVLQMPLNGCSVNKEIDIAVDFTAPSRPGRYISYWKMASPSGQKFGQRVWVLIQVDNSPPNSSAGSSHGNINLNLPPEVICNSGTGTIDVDTDPLDTLNVETNFTSRNAEEVKPSVVEIPIQEKESTRMDGLLGAATEAAQPVPAVNPLVSYPIIDFPASLINEAAQPIPAAKHPVSYPIIVFPVSSIDVPPIQIGSSSEVVANENLLEQSLLKDLEEMGFKQMDLNKEILRRNEYDLEQSVDDLCGFAEWDPLLNELQEMGFHDMETNKKLLIKNGGSIKRVVLDLVAKEKAGK